MNVDLMFPSKYVKCADLMGKPAVVTIATVKLDEVQTADGKKSKKAVVTFEKTEKAWIMNKTCAKAIKKAYGAETNAWIGKKIELYPTTCEAFGEIVDCVRVRMPVNGKSTGKPKPATVEQPTPEEVEKWAGVEPPPHENLPPDVDPETGEVLEPGALG